MAARVWLLATVILSVFVGPGAAAARAPKASTSKPKLEILSVTGVQLGKGERLWSFRVDLQHAKIVAVCGFPDGWDMKFGNYADSKLYKEGGAYVEGGAMFDHNALAPEALDGVDHLVLIRQDGPSAPRLDGSFTVQVGGKGESKRKFAPANLNLDPAARCPAQPSKPAGR
jgi:hypothetical protein